MSESTVKKTEGSITAPLPGVNVSQKPAIMPADGGEPTEVAPENGTEPPEKSTKSPDFEAFAARKGGYEAPKKEVKVEDIAPLPPERDLSDLPEESKQLFRKMDNIAFKTLKPIFLEHKLLKEQLAKKDAELKKALDGKPTLPDSYYTHPKAYTLTDDYGKLSAITDGAGQIVEHWRAQLLSIKKNQKWQNLTFDSTKGEFVLSEPMEPSPEAEAHVLTNLDESRHQLSEKKHELEDFKKAFTGRYETEHASIKALASKYFSGYEKPEHPSAPIQKVIRENLPNIAQNTPLTDLFVFTGAANIMIQQESQKKDEKIKQLEATIETMKSSGLTEKNFSAAGAKTATPKVPSYEDWEKRRNEGYVMA